MVPPHRLPAGRFVLVALDERNAAIAAALGRDTEVRRWTFHRDGMTGDQVRALGTASRRAAVLGRGARYVVHEGPEPLGTVGITLTGAVPEVYYALLPEARGRGAAAAAVRALTGFAFRSGRPRVRARVMPGNAASERVLRRAGFVPAGRETDRRDGRTLAVWLATAP